jgi:hypothetical protein
LVPQSYGTKRQTALLPHARGGRPDRRRTMAHGANHGGRVYCSASRHTPQGDKVRGRVQNRPAQLSPRPRRRRAVARGALFRGGRYPAAFLRARRQTKNGAPRRPRYQRPTTSTTVRGPRGGTPNREFTKLHFGDSNNRLRAQRRRLSAPSCRSYRVPR